MPFPSTFLDIQSAVIKKARLDTSSAAIDTAAVKDWINQTYFQVCVETEAIVTLATMTLTAGSYSYTFPAGVARAKQIMLTPFGQTSTFQQPPLQRTTLDDILWRRANGGVPQQATNYSRYYALAGINDFELWPTPPAADVLTIYYAAFPTALSANGDLPMLEEPYASKLLEYGALVQGGDLLGDPATDEWQNDYDLWMQRYLNHLEQKKGDLPVQFHQWGSLADTRALYGGW